jgi:CO/xanthine dehydrogenase Mo-binding subunit
MTDTLHHTTFTRDTFLKGTGALVIGFSIAGSAVAGKASAAATRGDVAGPPDPGRIDSWLQINADNTATIYIGKVELGQGSPTALLQIAAEELDLDFSQVQKARVDTNTTPDQGSTVGSGSIARGGPQIRQASAEARQALLGLASAKLGVPAAQLSVSKGVVSGGGKSTTYGELIGGRLFNVPFTGKAPQKKVADYKIVGTRVPRLDIPDKISGKYTYVHNVRVPGMLHGRVVRPRGQAAYGTGAKPLSIDESSIKNLPNVQVVRRGDFVGVVSPHEYAAIQAAAQLKVKWAENEMLPGNGDIFGDMRRKKTADTVAVDTGNVDAGLEQASKVLSQSYQYAYQMHGSMGPCCSVADVKPGSAMVLSSTQGVYGLRKKLADVLNMDESRIRVQYFEGSGCYGHTAYDDAAQAAAVLSQAVGKPVRLQFMRWDEHGWENYGPAQLTDIRAGVDGKGKIVAYDYSVYAIPYFSMESTQELTGSPIPKPGTGRPDTSNTGSQYAIKNRRVTGKSLPLLEGYLKSIHLRAPLAPQSTFASEQMIDELAHAAGMDPVEFRRQNIADERWLGVLEAVAALAKWQPKTAASELSGSSVVHGRGIAIAGYARSYAGVVADVEVNKKTGKIVARHMYASQDAGLVVNPAFVENQMEGNLVQATSRALIEEVVTSKKRVTSLDWASYPILRFRDHPNVSTVLVNRPEIASTGSGEPPTAPTAAAIANAFFDATGVRIRQAPMTPGKVRAVLAAAKRA